MTSPSPVRMSSPAASSSSRLEEEAAGEDIQPVLGDLVFWSRSLSHSTSEEKKNARFPPICARLHLFYAEVIEVTSSSCVSVRCLDDHPWQRRLSPEDELPLVQGLTFGVDVVPAWFPEMRLFQRPLTFVDGGAEVRCELDALIADLQSWEHDGPKSRRQTFVEKRLALRLHGGRVPSVCEHNVEKNLAQLEEIHRAVGWTLSGGDTRPSNADMAKKHADRYDKGFLWLPRIFVLNPRVHVLFGACDLIPIDGFLGTIAFHPPSRVLIGSLAHEHVVP